MASGLIFGVQRFSTEDGPGIRTTAFLKGCPMRCPWCQNPEGMSSRKDLLWSKVRCLGDDECQRSCPPKALSRIDEALLIDRALCDECGKCADRCPSGALEVAGTERESGDLVEELGRDRGFYASSGGGVTLSGGEPLVQIQFLTDVLDGLGKAGIHRALDTCGAVGTGVLEQVLGRVDLVLYDLKQMDPASHMASTGIALERVLGNARCLARSGVPTWVRTPVIPGHTDAEDNVRAIARFVRVEMPATQRYDLLAFSRLCASKYERMGVAPEKSPASLPLLTRAHMEKLQSVAIEEGLKNVVWSGMTAD